MVSRQEVVPSLQYEWEMLGCFDCCNTSCLLWYSHITNPPWGGRCLYPCTLTKRASQHLAIASPYSSPLERVILERWSIVLVRLYAPSRQRGQDPWLPATVQIGWTPVLVWSEECGHCCEVQSPMPLLRYMQQLFTDVKRGLWIRLAACGLTPTKRVGELIARLVYPYCLFVWCQQWGCLLTLNPFALKNLWSSFWFRANLLSTLGSARHFWQVGQIQMAYNLEHPLQALHETTN